MVNGEGCCQVRLLVGSVGHVALQELCKQVRLLHANAGKGVFSSIATQRNAWVWTLRTTQWAGSAMGAAAAASPASGWSTARGFLVSLAKTPSSACTAPSKRCALQQPACTNSLVDTGMAIPLKRWSAIGSSSTRGTKYCSRFLKPAERATPSDDASWSYMLLLLDKLV